VHILFKIAYMHYSNRSNDRASVPAFWRSRQASGLLFGQLE